ncbi:hypothetical protein NEOC65_001069 [Neochlamydia sp. AcF65]|nr:hypothetical protein [Neochlamydia sp. AcF65]
MLLRFLSNPLYNRRLYRCIFLNREVTSKALDRQAS